MIEWQREFGWTRAEIARSMAALFLGAIIMPLFGQLIDRVGARAIVIISSVVMTLAYVALASMHGTLSEFYLIFALMVVLGAGTTPVAITRPIVSAFEHGRGAALATTLTGVSIFAIILPPVLTALIQAQGWRVALVALALLPLTIGLPALIRWFHDSPGRKQALGDGIASSVAIGPLQALRLFLFWRLAFAIAFVTAAALGLVSQLQPLLIDKGFRPEQAALLGMAQGAELDLLAFLVSRYFGMRRFSSIYALVNLFYALSVAGSSILFGQLYDKFGNYDYALSIAAACLLAGAGLMLSLGPYPLRSAPPANRRTDIS